MISQGTNELIAGQHASKLSSTLLRGIAVNMSHDLLPLSLCQGELIAYEFPNTRRIGRLHVLGSCVRSELLLVRISPHMHREPEKKFCVYLFGVQIFVTIECTGN